MPTTRITSQDIKDSAIVDADISASAAIQATKIAGGTVDNTEFGHLNGVTGPIQTQLDQRVILDPSTTGRNLVQPNSGIVSEITALSVRDRWIDSLADYNVFVVEKTDGTDVLAVVNNNNTLRVVVDARLDLKSANSLMLFDSDNSHSVGIKAAGTTSASYTITLPATAPGANQILQSDGSGNLSWVNPSSGVAGNATEVQYNAGGGAFGADTGLTYVAGTNTLTVGAANEAGTLVLRDQGGIKFEEDNLNGTDAITLRGPASTAGYTLTLPSASPGLNQILVSDNSGVFSWSLFVASVSTANDTNVTLTASGSTGAITLTVGWTGTLAIARGGTGAGNKTAAFDNLSPLTTKGDLLTHDGINNIRRAIGSQDQLLVVDSGGNAVWAKPDHGASLTGLGDDDHTQYAHKTPANAARNTITATATNVTPLTLAVPSGVISAVTVFDVQGQSSAVLFRVNIDTVNGDHLLSNLPLWMRGAKAVRFYDSDNSHSVGLRAHATTTAAYTITLPAGAPAANQMLQSDASGNLSWVTSTAGPHNLLDNASHPDTATGTVVRGDIIVGNSTPAWARLAKGSNLQVLVSNATDVVWATLTRSHLPAEVGYLDENESVTNNWTFAAAAQFKNNCLTLRNPANTFSATVNVGAITAARTYTIPEISANGTFALLEGTQTFSGTKTFASSGLRIGGLRVHIIATAVSVSSKTVTIPDVAGNFMIDASVDTITGAKTFDNGTLLLRNSGNTQSTTLNAPNATAGRTISLPDADGTVALLSLAQTWTAAQTFDANVVVNEAGANNVGLRVEGDTLTHLLYTDPANDRVGVNTSAPAARLEIEGVASSSLHALELDLFSATSADPINDAAFVNYKGESNADQSGNITTDTSATLQGFVKVQINGATKWMPYYDFGNIGS